MGPIRAFSRPSHAAGGFATSTSPYSHTPGFSSARRPCCAHASTSLGPQHPALTHPHLYSSVCAADPLRAGLVSSPAAPSTCLFHFKKLLPPGAAPSDAHLAVPAQQNTGGASQGATRDAVGHEKRKDIYEHGWKNGDEYEWNNKYERKSKKKNSENKSKKHKQENKWKQHNSLHKRSAKKPEYEWDRQGDTDLWMKNEIESKQKNRKDELQLNKSHKGHQEVRSEEENESGNERREAKWSKDKLAPPPITTTVSKADDPCTSRMPLSFPFSDDDDDDDCGHEGKGNKESNEELWPISDIVETEDEEGENQSGHVQDTSGDDCDSDCPLPAIVDTGVGEAESVGVALQHLPSAADHGSSIVTPNGESEGEGVSSDLCAVLELRDSPSTGEKSEIHNEYDVDDENDLEEHENEGKTTGEDEYPRDGVRSTQRLRPRSYR